MLIKSFVGTRAVFNTDKVSFLVADDTSFAGAERSIGFTNRSFDGFGSTGDRDVVVRGAPLRGVETGCEANTGVILGESLLVVPIEEMLIAIFQGV